MDKLKEFTSKIGGGGTGGNQSNQTGGGEDYLDKAVDQIEKKTGHTFSREQNERITDAGREQFEKATGKDIPDKFSN